VAMGMLFDPQILVKQPFQVLAVLAIIVLGKSATAFLVVVLLGRPIGSALVVAASLAQIGEFSFILAGALLSIAMNSFLMRAVGAIRRRIEPASVAG
jgi:CPA2 family monovalent cation:H+ antiporter-2